MEDYIESPTHNTQFRVRESLRGTCEWEAPILDRFQNVLHSIKPEVEFVNNRNRQSCAYAGLRIVRHVNYYVIRYYLTTFLMVVMCFAEFYFPTNGWPARIILTAVILVTLLGVSREGYDEVPSKDVTSLYWWLWGCQFFIYMSLVEFAAAQAWVQFVGDKKIAHAKSIVSVTE